MTRGPVLRTALSVSLLVGTCLNLINQGAAVWHGAAIDWLRLGLNYLVPFCVSAFSGVRAARTMASDIPDRETTS
ncbi:MAG: nitrate/nitrite transporter NrtS [Alphaproteobacteria bacterium]|nr:nitrate/nitrite transporter NrtS [Alphaproteobacteria bacterium]